MDEEKRNRIRIAVFAYAYEVLNESIISDSEYDALAKTIDVSISTDNIKLDNFFKRYYTADTGVWVRKHPGFKDGSLEHIARLLLKKNMESKQLDNY